MGRWVNRQFLARHCAPEHLYNMVARPPESYGLHLAQVLFHALRQQRYHDPTPSKETYDVVQLPGETGRTKSLYDLPTNPY